MYITISEVLVAGHAPLLVSFSMFVLASLPTDSLPLHEAVLPLPYHFKQTDPAHQARWTGSLKRGSLKRSRSLRYCIHNVHVCMSLDERRMHIYMYVIYLFNICLILRRKRTIREGDAPREGLKRTGSFGNKKELILRRTEKRSFLLF